MPIKILRSKEEIDQILKDPACRSLGGGGSFLKSFQWAEFQKSYGRKYWHLYEENTDSLAVLFKQGAVGVNYFYSPRGKLTRELLEEVAKLAKQEHCVFLRIDPENEIENLRNEYKLIKTKDVQPQNSWVLKLDKDSEKLLSDMKSKTRYNIRLAQKKKLEVLRSTDIKDLGIFCKLSEKTAKRQKIRIHPKSYYQKMFKAFQEGELNLYLARANNQVIAANMVIFFGKWATYLHGSTSDKYRNLMAPYMLQWQAILDAKERGCKYYDFGGVAPAGQEDHPWSGITRFKMGFDGERFTYPVSYDIVFKPVKYRLYQLLRLLNQVVRK